MEGKYQVWVGKDLCRIEEEDYKASTLHLDDIEEVACKALDIIEDSPDLMDKDFLVDLLYDYFDGENRTSYWDEPYYEYSEIADVITMLFDGSIYKEGY